MLPTIITPVKNGIANPAPLGLYTFGMITVLLDIHHAGYEMKSMILAMGIFYSGLAQVVAGGSGIYTGIPNSVNEMYGRILMPTGAVR